MPYLKSFIVLLISFGGPFQLLSEDTSGPFLQPAFSIEEVAPLPMNLRGFALGSTGNSIIAAGGFDADGIPQRAVYRYDATEGKWNLAGEMPKPWADGAFASFDSGLILIGGESDDQQVLQVQLINGSLEITTLPDLPFIVEKAAASIGGNSLYLAGIQQSETVARKPVFLRLSVSKSLSFLQGLLSKIGFNFDEETIAWEELDVWPGASLEAATLDYSFESIHLFGISSSSGQPAGFAYHPDEGWRTLNPPSKWTPTTITSSLGEAHLFAIEGSPEEALAATPGIYAYHTLTDSWVETGILENPPSGDVRIVTIGGDLYLISGISGQKITVLPPTSNYGWVDHLVVIIYLLGMVGMGAWFVRREKNTKDFFRAGNKVPFWAIGMSLFATGASAISLMTMPGKSYSTNWTFFVISVFSVLCLPISIFLLAPLVRKLDISTPNEYLELRFGLTARMIGSIIYMVNQILGRMAPIIFLPSIAMAAITGIDIWIWILVIGSVTTLYTFMGGLSAVIWTDTVQGLIMVSTVAGCLILILFKIDMPLDQVWTTLQDNNKLHMIDWGWDITEPVVTMILIGCVFLTFSGIGDQNFVQRIQAAPSLKDAKKALATQMAVVLPINLLLFGLGTALYLYYRAHPIELNPIMKTDGVYPLFAAQQLPVGVSGLVIAALLAASMSTISSAICSVANLGIEDFYRRFSRSVVVEKRALFYARVISILVGVLGIIGAIFLSKSDSKSVWDVALIITGLITNGTVGFFGLGLLTRRAHELGALIGLVAGMIVTIYLDAFTPVTFWLYVVFGSTVTFVVGYTASLVLPHKAKNLDGLTLYSLDKPRPRL